MATASGSRTKATSRWRRSGRKRPMDSAETLKRGLSRAVSDPIWRAKLSELRRRAERKRLEDSLLEFLVAAWPWIDPAPYVENWHLEAVADHLEAVTWGKIKRWGANVPPRSGKSSL